MPRSRILLADDHKIFMDGLVRLLEPNYEIVGTVENGRELLAAARQKRPELVIADVSMPLLNGIEAVRRLKKLNKNIKVIILTMHHDATFAAEALRAGAAGYILKNSGAAELQGAIRDVLKGRTYLSPLVTKEAVTELMNPARTGRSRLPLTDRQREVLQLVSEGLTLKEVSHALKISLSTVEFHKLEAMRRLGLESTAELIRYAISHGISSVDAPAAAGNHS